MTLGVHLSLWRNRLARSAVNRKVGGSSPPRGDLFSFYYIMNVQKWYFFLIQEKTQLYVSVAQLVSACLPKD